MAYKSYMAQALKRIEAEVKSEVIIQSEALQTEAEALIREPKSGRVYMHPQPAPHTSSAPGEPWANWTGATAASFYTDQRNNGMTGVFGSTSLNALRLEVGTEKMDARPLFRPVLTNRQQSILKGLAAALRRGTT